MALIWMTVSHPMRACENRFLFVCFVSPTSSHSPIGSLCVNWLCLCFHWLVVDICQWLCLHVLSILDTSSYYGVILVCIIISHTNISVYYQVISVRLTYCIHIEGKISSVWLELGYKVNMQPITKSKHSQLMRVLVFMYSRYNIHVSIQYMFAVCLNSSL